MATIIASDPAGDIGMDGVQERFRGKVLARERRHRDIIAALLPALTAIVEFCDDPNGSEKPESLAMGMARMLPAARAAILKAESQT